MYDVELLHVQPSFIHVCVLIEVHDCPCVHG